jgi:uncharacterized protein YbbK (DUF523 family)
MKKLLVSACLLGEPLRYDGNDNAGKVSHLKSLLSQWQEEGRIIPVCPETLGGLPTPRPPAEAERGGGSAVLTRIARVLTYTGDNVTQAFIHGAEKALATAQRHHCQGALLAARSPSCGVSEIYDGSHTRTLIAGDGVTTALLKQHNIVCFTPNMADELIQWMNHDD